MIVFKNFYFFIFILFYFSLYNKNDMNLSTSPKNEYFKALHIFILEH